MQKITTSIKCSDALGAGRRLAAVRVSKRLTQEAAAAAVGAAKRTWISWERGERDPPSSCLRALHRLYGIDPLWILEGPGLVPQTRVLAKDPELLATAEAIFDELKGKSRAVFSSNERHAWISDLYAALARTDDPRERAAVIEGLALALKRR